MLARHESVRGEPAEYDGKRGQNLARPLAQGANGKLLHEELIMLVSAAQNAGD